MKVDPILKGCKILLNSRCTLSSAFKKSLQCSNGTVINSISCRSISSHPADPTLLKKTIHPLRCLTEDEAKEVQTVLSLDIGLRSISFSRVSRDFNLLDWGVHTLNKSKPYNPGKFVTVVNEIVDQLPVSDIAIIEIQSFYSRTENPSLFPFVLHNRITEAILHAQLQGRAKKTIGIDANVVRKYFEIRKGRKKNYYSPSILQGVMEERLKKSKPVDEEQLHEFVLEHKADVGSKDLILETLQQRRTDTFLSFENISGSSSKVSISLQQVQYYLDHINKSDLGDSFLQAVAFLDLEVYRGNYF